jgi:hypothetical protein
MSNPNVTAIAQYAAKHSKALIITLITSMAIANDIAVYGDVKDEFNLPRLTISDGARPYSSTTEFGDGTVSDLVYDERILEVKKGKRETQIDVEEYRTTYLRDMLPMGSGSDTINQAHIPFAQYTMEAFVKKLASELNNKTAYFGFDKTDAVAFDNGDAYAVNDYVTFTVKGRTEWFKCVTITTAGQTPLTHPAKWTNVTANAITKGLKYHIDEALTAGDITAVTTGAISSGSTAKTAFLKLYRSAPDAYKEVPMVIHCSYTDYEWYLDGIEDVTKYTRDDASKTLTAKGYFPLINSNGMCWIKPCSWLSGSRRLIMEELDMATMRGKNLAMGTDSLSDLNKIAVEKHSLWLLDVGISFLLGFQISDVNALWVGDQA